ncbi:actin-like ATPase domain-containing protein [Dothidotthia symphoricarpi CBS 119687]|uniref:Actin-like ATPase domain-containing protein n=1 Tax=Dothidotthia symphoricarpi CBS 119687 TaxID=1392245 RepID=A0A6A5ZZV4_9PLEO|nr:actin-like ATPase domain-containing protein [Dothidotthia symphoricarpi CBS 119687]KAF2124816.1 actin-like ATPase domain-containing protein [Dothidotthia symphoricarpi CBS 119687]
MAPPGRRRASLSPATMLLGLAFLFSSTASAASAVLGVDLGTEYIKAALVKPGIPLEIVLTKDSKRKETSAVAFKPSKSGPLATGSYPERFYGGDAIALQARFPGDVYPNLKHLLGAVSDSDVVSVYTGRYPALEVKGTDGRKTVSFSSGVFAAEGERSFSVEELLAMELKNVRENAKALAGKGYDVQDVVFTVPPFYTVEEKRALEVAANLAGLKVLSIVTDGMAVGINYATSRTFPTVTDGSKPEINLVFDMGAGSASATILQFQGRAVKDVGRRNKTIQEVQVLGVGWDRTLGGDGLNSLIVDDMVSSFVELPSAKSASITAEKVRSHGRTAAKLFKEAERVRQVLSANTATAAFFESFFEDVDFRYKLSRTQYEALATEYAARVEGPINQALEAAGLTFADIDSVIVHGGATRTPFVQSRLEAIAGKAKIRANVNSDEAAVFGAAFKAAGLSPSFRVKEIRDSDAQGYSHGIQYKHNLKNRDQKIFSPSSKFGATKDLPFQMMGEFEFTVYQAVGASKDPTLQFKSGNLTQTVAKMIETDGCDRASFNNYVQVRLSPITGTPEVLSAWATCETDSEAKGGIVDGVKNLFGMGGKKDQEALKEGESASESSTSSSSIKSKSKSKKSASSSSSSAGAESTGKAGEKKKKVIKSAITYDVKHLGYEKHPRKEIKTMQDRIAAFDASDKSRRVREEVLNSLEAFTYKARDHLEDESFIGASIAAVRSTLEEKLSAASDWIYSDGAEADEKTLKAKLKELEDIVNPVLTRKREAWKRPDAITELQETINHMKEVKALVDNQLKEQVTASSKSSEAVASASASASATPSPSSKDPLDDLDEDAEPAAPEPTEIPEVVTVYTDADLKSLDDLTVSTQKWLDDAQAKQDKLAPSDDPVLTVVDLTAEKKKLDDMVMEMMMKRMKAFNKPPKPKATPKTKPKSKSKKTKTAKPTPEPKVDEDVKSGEEDKPTTQENAHPHPDSQAQMEDMEQGNIDHKVLGGGDAPTKEQIQEALRKAGINQESDWENQGPPVGEHNEL